MTVGLELPPGISVNRRYRIQRVLGRGGFGRTYLAIDEWRFGEPCVLKEFVPSSQGDSVVAQKLHELFHREATILHKLNHPQIPKFFAVFEEDGRLFIAQEYIDGKTCWTVLQERQRQGRTFTEAEVVQWLRNLLQVLDYLHRQNIVHRDISPDNIMLPRGRKHPVLIDFGVVKQAATHFYGINADDPDGLIQASVSVGKFGYAPYEQIRMGQCSPRSDLYALAVTAVVLLTGRTPNLLIDSQSLEWQWHTLVKLDPHLVKILDKMMAEKPQDRYPSAQAVLKDLRPLRRWAAMMRSSLNIPSQTSAEDIYNDPAPALPPWQASLIQLEADSLQSMYDDSDDDYGENELPTGKTRIELANLATVPPVIDQPTANPFPLPLHTRFWLASDLNAGYPQVGHPPNPATAADVVASLKPTALLSKPKVIVGEASKPFLSLRKMLVLGVLAMLPMGGAVVGVQSPYIASLCQALNNCAIEQSQARYRQVMEQANGAKALSENAQNIADLQHARDRLADSIAQLNAFSSSSEFYAAAQAVLPDYQTLRQSLETRLERELRAAQLLQRAEAEAQKAAEQTEIAKTSKAYAAAQAQWQKVLQTLRYVPESTFAYGRAVARLQEYKTRMEAASLRAPAQFRSTAQGQSEPTIQISPIIRMQPTTTAAIRENQANPGQPNPSSSPSRPAPAAVAPQPNPQPSRSMAPGPIARRPSQTVNSTRSNPTRQTPAPTVAQSPRRAGLGVAGSSRSMGTVLLSATQTVNDVAVWIDGARVNSAGSYVVNLMIKNYSDRPFGFVPLFAEVKDASNQTIRSRILFGRSDAVVDPGQTIQGEVYILDRQWRASGPQNLTLIIREGTSGTRRFRISF